MEKIAIKLGGVGVQIVSATADMQPSERTMSWADNEKKKTPVLQDFSMKDAMAEADRIEKACGGKSNWKADALCFNLAPWFEGGASSIPNLHVSSMIVLLLLQQQYFLELQLQAWSASLSDVYTQCDSHANFAVCGS